MIPGHDLHQLREKNAKLQDIVDEPHWKHDDAMILACFMPLDDQIAEALHNFGQILAQQLASRHQDHVHMSLQSDLNCHVRPCVTHCSHEDPHIPRSLHQVPNGSNECGQSSGHRVKTHALLHKWEVAVQGYRDSNNLCWKSLSSTCLSQECGVHLVGEISNHHQAVQLVPHDCLDCTLQMILEGQGGWIPELAQQVLPTQVPKLVHHVLRHWCPKVLDQAFVPAKETNQLGRR
mmetsp:Transcript_20192/g.42190  ORF Transcript_20192/g.42190 Transcript_20192/m.42190 type:complete len:234 (+) Transcript_20192:1053-1754(+)